MARREIPEINAGSMADIAFLLLIFFLVTTTMNVETGITRMLPPPLPPDQQEPPPIKERNVFIVLINKNNDLLAQGEPIQLSALKDLVKTFIQNPNDYPDMSEKKAIEVDFLGTVSTSKGIVSLQNDRGTAYKTYIAVQNELVKAFNELRNEFSQKHFGKNFDYLDAEHQEVVKKIYPLAISEAEPRNVDALK